MKHSVNINPFYYQNSQKNILHNPKLHDSGNQEDGEQDLKLVEKRETSIRPPSMYKVVLLNDDYTPMEFVIDILIRFFRHNEDQATQIMLSVHQQGKGVCGIYTKDIAETKAAQVNQYARQNKYPLLCDIEPLD